MAVAEKVAVSPGATVLLAGFVTIVGGVLLTVRVAGLLVAFPAELLTTTRNCAPLSVVDTGGVV